MNQDTLRWLEKRVRRYRNARTGPHWSNLLEAVTQQGEAPKPKPQVKDAISMVSYDKVVAALRQSALKNLRPQFLDRNYTALPMEKWQEILEYSDVDRVQYVSELRDCDNFAIALAGQVALRFGVNGIGIVVDFSGRHAYNCLLVSTSDGGLEIKVVEPQSDGMPKVGDRLSGHEAYKAQNGWILFA